MSEPTEWDSQEQFDSQIRMLRAAGTGLSVETLLGRIQGHWVFVNTGGGGLIYDRFTGDLVRLSDGWMVLGTAMNSTGPGRTAYNLRYYQATDTLEWTAIGLRHTAAGVSSDSADIQVKVDLDTKSVALVVRAYRIPFQGSVHQITNGSYLVASPA